MVIKKYFMKNLIILEGVGKTSIIMALVHDNFCANVPARCEQVLIPRDVSPDGVLTEIIDYSRILFAYIRVLY
jgi:GTPase SAR1 family protein